MHIALLGTGLMGRALAERLLASGHAVSTYNRTQAKAEPLRALGAQVADTPAAAIEHAECVMLMLADARAIRETLLGTACRAHLADRTVVQMGTIGPEESDGIASAVTRAGGEYLEAPVLGSLAEARAGALEVLVGGTPAQFARWMPVLRCLGPEPVLVGPVGHAAKLKLALNQLIASLTTAFSLSLGLMRRAQIDVELFMRVLRRSALYAPTFDKKLPRMQDREYTQPNFPTRHLLKDVRLGLAAARACGLATTALEGVERVVAQACTTELADLDYSALYEVVDPPQ